MYIWNVRKIFPVRCFDRRTVISRESASLEPGGLLHGLLWEAKLVSGVSTQGVYNPHTESAKSFADRWEINWYADMEHFYADIDVVYIATPHETHYSYIKDALNHGKHVICEKPMVLKRQQAEELFELAKEKGLILFEGIKTAYCPGFHKLLGIAASGSIGAIRNIEACFTKLEKPDTRELTDINYGGSFIGAWQLLLCFRY